MIRPWRLAGLAVLMFGFGFALVPAYNLLCDVTGLNGKTNAAPALGLNETTTQRTVEVRLISASPNSSAWSLEPEVPMLTVPLGQFVTTHFKAHNKTSSVVLGQAVPSITPAVASKYLQKLECFCFVPQSFEANESRDLMVKFFIDPALPAHVESLALAYTFVVKPITG